MRHHISCAWHLIPPCCQSCFAELDKCSDGRAGRGARWVRENFCCCSVFFFLIGAAWPLTCSLHSPRYLYGNHTVTPGHSWRGFCSWIWAGPGGVGCTCFNRVTIKDTIIVVTTVVNTARVAVFSMYCVELARRTLCFAICHQQVTLGRWLIHILYLIVH